METMVKIKFKIGGVFLAKGLSLKPSVQGVILPEKAFRPGLRHQITDEHALDVITQFIELGVCQAEGGAFFSFTVSAATFAEEIEGVSLFLQDWTVPGGTGDAVRIKHLFSHKGKALRVAKQNKLGQQLCTTANVMIQVVANVHTGVVAIRKRWLNGGEMKTETIVNTAWVNVDTRHEDIRPFSPLLEDIFSNV